MTKNLEANARAAFNGLADYFIGHGLGPANGCLVMAYAIGYTRAFIGLGVLDQPTVDCITQGWEDGGKAESQPMAKPTTGKVV